MSLRRLLLSLPLLLLLLVVAGWFWLLHTEAGARWVWSQAESAADGALHAATTTGALSSGLVLRDVAFDSDGVSIDVSRAALSVDVQVLPVQITVQPATLSGLRIDLHESESVDEDAKPEDVLASLQLPIEVIFEDVRLEDGVLAKPDGDVAPCPEASASSEINRKRARSSIRRSR